MSGPQAPATLARGPGCCCCCCDARPTDGPWLLAPPPQGPSPGLHPAARCPHGDRCHWSLGPGARGTLSAKPFPALVLGQGNSPSPWLATACSGVPGPVSDPRCAQLPTLCPPRQLPSVLSPALCPGLIPRWPGQSHAVSEPSHASFSLDRSTGPRLGLWSAVASPRDPATPWVTVNRAVGVPVLALIC